MSGSVVGKGETPEAAPAARPPPPHAAAQPKESTLDSRVQMLTRALDLDAAQQLQLKKVLESQRVELLKVWRDASVPQGDRIGATRAINNQTADRIRALLTEEQRKKYKSPEPTPPAGAAPGTRTVEDWMKMANPHAPPATAQR